jgi:hypothetical protein
MSLARLWRDQGKVRQACERPPNKLKPAHECRLNDPA